MKTILFVVLLLIASVVHAQPQTINDRDECAYTELDGYSYFDSSYFQRTDHGWYIFHFCWNPDKQAWLAYGNYCTHGKCLQNTWNTMLIALGTATNKIQAQKDMMKQYVDEPDCNTEIAANTANTPICNELKAAMKAAAATLPFPDKPPVIPPVVTLPPPPVPTILWSVPKAASNANPPGTRPVYSLTTTGQKGSVFAGVRVKENEMCDCTVQIRDGGTSYCTVPSLKHNELVSVCDISIKTN